MADMMRESMDFDVVIVGGGPAGLSAAIRLRQCDPQLSVCLLEKGAEIGAHILAGAVIEPRALEELIPDWKEKGAPLDTPVTRDSMLYLTRARAFTIPMLERVMPHMNNHGNYVASLADLCRWLATQAEALGVEIYPGFAAVELLFDEDNRLAGVASGDMGVGRDGTPGPNFARGMELRARYTLFAEGCRGSLSKQLMAHYGLCRDSAPQTYGLGIKEIWEIPPEQHHPGLVQHSFGWPLSDGTYGGSWLYHFGENKVSYGFVVGLDYANPWLSPFEEGQRLKHHPAIYSHLKGGRRLAYGARALSEGGVQALPRLTFPGGALVGDAAGFLNVPKIKGTHTAMKSGMLAAEALVEAMRHGQAEPRSYTDRLRRSWLWKELYEVRNIRPSFSHFGDILGALYSSLDAAVLRGRAPWTLRHKKPDHARLQPAARARRISYPKPDGVMSFDRASSVYLANIAHDENQPVHLKLGHEGLWARVNRDRFAAPETRYCPAGVYETDDSGQELRINAQNCVHCKTCDIKDPVQNINWTPPEGGSGPHYPGGM